MARFQQGAREASEGTPLLWNRECRLEAGGQSRFVPLCPDRAISVSARKASEEVPLQPNGKRMVGYFLHATFKIMFRNLPKSGPLQQKFAYI